MKKVNQNKIVEVSKALYSLKRFEEICKQIYLGFETLQSSNEAREESIFKLSNSIIYFNDILLELEKIVKSKKVDNEIETLIIETESHLETDIQSDKYGFGVEIYFDKEDLPVHSKTVTIKKSNVILILEYKYNLEKSYETLEISKMFRQESLHMQNSFVLDLKSGTIDEIAISNEMSLCIIEDLKLAVDTIKKAFK